MGVNPFTVKQPILLTIWPPEPAASLTRSQWIYLGQPPTLATKALRNLNHSSEISELGQGECGIFPCWREEEKLGSIFLHTETVTESRS